MNRIVSAPVKPMPPEEDEVLLEDIFKYHSESRAVLLDMPPHYKKCGDQQYKERCASEHESVESLAQCNLSQSVDRRKDWKSWVWW